MSKREVNEWLQAYESEKKVTPNDRIALTILIGFVAMVVLGGLLVLLDQAVN